MDQERALLVQSFLSEAEETLLDMEESLVQLERSPADAEFVATLFRGAHTLKGNAAIIDYAAVVELAHAMEDVLDAVRARKLRADAALVAMLFQAIDALRTLVGELPERAPELSSSQRQLVSTLRGFTTAQGAMSPGHTKAGSSPPDAAPAGWMLHNEARTLRVDVRKLDRMLNLTGEMAVVRGRMQQVLSQGGKGALERALELHRESERLHLDLQELVTRARMVPVGPLFRQYSRMVRDLAAAEGKQARLVIQGGDVEVDTAVVERMRDAIMHMLRNATHHGLERPDERRTRGKPPMGTITLRAYHDARSLVVQIADDGAGLQRSKLAVRARTDGLDPDRMSDYELHQLIFEPGFSTAEQLTEVSGRGVGMDVVRRSVEALHGTIAVDTADGAGTTVTLRLPLTLAIIDGFMVGAGGDTFVVPLDAVVECVELPPEPRTQHDVGILPLRGAALPFVHLSEVLGMERTCDERPTVVVVEHNGVRAGIVVDVLHGESQAVIKPLGKLFDCVSFTSGATVLGNGGVGLILDVAAILRWVVQRQTRQLEPAADVHA